MVDSYSGLGVKYTPDKTYDKDLSFA